ncbi:hypothetical protein ACFQ0M_12210 [Kitasatospora aburaviensis]
MTAATTRSTNSFSARWASRASSAGRSSAVTPPSRVLCSRRRPSPRRRAWTRAVHGSAMGRTSPSL